MRLVNLRDYPNGLPPGFTRIDRRTRYGNPYRINGSVTREQAVELHAPYLEERLKADPNYLLPLKHAKGLGCWCAPLLCHGKNIIRKLEELYGG